MGGIVWGKYHLEAIHWLPIYVRLLAEAIEKQEKFILVTNNLSP